MSDYSDEILAQFVDRVHTEGRARYRSFAWRETSDPYAVLLSEIMLQQTQTARVERYFESWLERFPSIDALAAASKADVLEAWQGLGYNRRALMLKKLADELSAASEGKLPQHYEELLALPGVGPATAAGVLAFAYNQPSSYLETNVRAVVLHELMPERDEVSDTEIRTLITRAAAIADAKGISPRAWNYALLDYGVWLKKHLPNPSRRSKHHSKQSKFEGSFRQKRAKILSLVLAKTEFSFEQLYAELSWEPEEINEAAQSLIDEGFITLSDEGMLVVESAN